MKPIEEMGLADLKNEKMAIEAAIIAWAFLDVKAPEWAEQQGEDLNRVCARIKKLERPKGDRQEGSP